MSDVWARKWYDETVEREAEDLATFSTEEICQAKLDSLLYDWKVLTWGGQIPRRLGQNATGLALAVDKKFFKKAINLQRNLTKTWGPLCPGFTLPEGEPTEFAAEHKQEGAQMNPVDWVGQRIARARAQRADAVTAALQLELKHWASRAANAYNQEIDGLERIAFWLAQMAEQPDQGAKDQKK